MKILTGGLLALTMLTGCVSQTPQVQDVESRVSAEQQLAAQAQLAATKSANTLALKRKLAVASITNETNYGKSLLGHSSTDALGKKVSDMFMQSLSNSGNYLLFERPDIKLVQEEAQLTGQHLELVGVDTLVMGSLTQFGRAVTGESGFFSSSKKQQATATVDLRLVDTITGRVFSSVTGTGAASTETAQTMGFGSVASYDGSINDRAIGAAVNAAVEKLNSIILERTWAADILAVEDGQVFFSGGKQQGVKPGMTFDVFTRGKKIKSTTTGTYITLPGKKVAELSVESLFGNGELEEGAVGTITQGSISNQDLANIEVREQK